MVRFVVMMAALCGGAAAQELFSWNAFDVSVPLGKNWDLTLHSRLRTRDAFRHVAQVRGGPQITYQYERFAFRGAYYFEPDHPYRGSADETGSWEGGHRLFGSAEVELRPARMATAVPRFMLERFITKDGGQYNRYRLGGRMNLGGRTGPYVHHEWMFVNDGLHTLRNGAGMRFAMGQQWSLEAGWLFDYRTESWGGNRQAVVSSIRYWWGE